MYMYTHTHTHTHTHIHIHVYITQVLPCIIMFRDGIACDRIVGFEELGGVDDFSQLALERRLADKNIIEYRCLSAHPTASPPCVPPTVSPGVETSPPNC